MTNKEIAEGIEDAARVLMERGNTGPRVQQIFDNAKAFREECDELTKMADDIGAHDDA